MYGSTNIKTVAIATNCISILFLNTM